MGHWEGAAGADTIVLEKRNISAISNSDNSQVFFSDFQFHS